MPCAFMCCTPRVANAEGGGRGTPSRLSAGVEEDDEDGQQQPAVAWRMQSRYERRREASMMVDALAAVVAGGAAVPVPAPASARQQHVSPAEGQWWSDYYDTGDVTPPPPSSSRPAPAAPHGNRSMQRTLPRLTIRAYMLCIFLVPPLAPKQSSSCSATCTWPLLCSSIGAQSSCSFLIFFRSFLYLFT